MRLVKNDVLTVEILINKIRNDNYFDYVNDDGNNDVKSLIYLEIY